MSCSLPPDTKFSASRVFLPPRGRQLGRGGVRRSDAELLAGVSARDVGAIRELYERHAAWLSVRLSVAAVQRPEVLADALQDRYPALPVRVILAVDPDFDPERSPQPETARDGSTRAETAQTPIV